MANTSTMKSLDKLIIKIISEIRQSQKRSDETRIYDSIEIFLENCDTDVSLFWERMKYLEENKVIYNKPKKNGNYFYIPKRGQEIVSSPIDQKPIIDSLNNSVSTPQDFQDNLSLVFNGIDTLDKFIDAILFNFTQKSKTEKNLTNSFKRKILKIRFQKLFKILSLS